MSIISDERNPLSLESDNISQEINPLAGEIESITGKIASLAGEIGTISGEIESLAGEIESIAEEIAAMAEERGAIFPERGAKLLEIDFLSQEIRRIVHSLVAAATTFTNLHESGPMQPQRRRDTEAAEKIKCDDLRAVEMSPLRRTPVIFSSCL
jgi:methyl-accepting chemotaxis protein